MVFAALVTLQINMRGSLDFMQPEAKTENYGKDLPSPTQQAYNLLKGERTVKEQTNQQPAKCAELGHIQLCCA